MKDSKHNETVVIIVDDNEVQVPAGISVAAAVIGHDHSGRTYTHPVDGSSRAPYCLMGVCFECMMEINAEPNVQACLVTVENGMTVKRQVQKVEAK